MWINMRKGTYCQATHALTNRQMFCPEFVEKYYFEELYIKKVAICHETRFTIPYV